MFLLSKIFNGTGSNAGSQKKAVNRNFRIPLIGETAPSFISESTSGTIRFPDDYDSCWKIILSHPMDFTPVCSTELIELARLQKEFENNNVKLLIVSTDPLDTHRQWKTVLESIDYKKYDPQKIDFPIMDDSNLVIAKLYGMIHNESDNNKDVRGVFIIDPDNKIRAEYFYPQEVGRNMNEILRTVIALQISDNEKVMTPANWETGHDVIVPFPLKDNMALMNKESGDYYQYSWFMIFKKSNNGSS